MLYFLSFAGGCIRTGPGREGEGGQDPVTRAAIQSFDRSAKAVLLDASAISADLKEKLLAFKAGDTWTKNFVKRGLIS